MYVYLLESQFIWFNYNFLLNISRIVGCSAGLIGGNDLRGVDRFRLRVGMVGSCSSYDEFVDDVEKYDLIVEHDPNFCGDFKSHEPKMDRVELKLD